MGKQGVSRMGGPSPIPSTAVLTPSAAAIANGFGGGDGDDSVGKWLLLCAGVAL
jgi:hypothetical protein